MQHRNTFKNHSPENILLATCRHLGLQLPTDNYNILQPSFANYPRPQSLPHTQNGYHPSGKDEFSNNSMNYRPTNGGQKKRGRPPKNYQAEQMDQRVRMLPNYQYQQPQQPSKQDKQRIFAKILIEEGYGIGNAKGRVGFEFQLNFYYNALRSILFRSFKKLEEKVKTECKVDVVISQEHKSIKFKTQLCTFAKWLNDDESQTFKEYIKSVYDLNPQPVSKGKTVRLYNSILERWVKAKHLDGRYKDSLETTEKLN